MTYFAMMCNKKTISSKFGDIRCINHLRYKQGKAGVMLDIGAGHTNNSQIIPKLFGYDIFCNDLQQENNFKQIWRYQRY